MGKTDDGRELLPKKRKKQKEKKSGADNVEDGGQRWQGRTWGRMTPREWRSSFVLPDIKSGNL